MRDMNILEEMNDFRRLSGLLLESPGTLWLKIRSLADNYFDNVLDPYTCWEKPRFKSY